MYTETAVKYGYGLQTRGGAKWLQKRLREICGTTIAGWLRRTTAPVNGCIGRSRTRPKRNFTRRDSAGSSARLTDLPTPSGLCERWASLRACRLRRLETETDE